jgi:acetate kinase
MRVLALNCGSSSLKAAIIDSVRKERLFDCRVDKIEEVLDQVRKRAQIAPEAVAHRIVHGGERFVQPTRVDDAVLAEIEALEDLAPLHNPPAVAVLRAARAAYPDLPHIAVFDTAFHATLPRHAREYALPTELRVRFGIRRFGFHGISHSHVMECVAAHMRAPAATLRIISCHLGNGASVAAIEHGRSVETSMGMTPLEGLVMGTRAGDLDPGVLLHLLESGGLDVRRLDEILNKRSGLLGLTGTNDMREIERRAAHGDEDCRLAIELYTYRVRKYIGAYAAVMGGVDTIAFTGGVGENSALIRERCLQRLEFLGAQVLVVKADEELVMAQEAATSSS